MQTLLILLGAVVCFAFAVHLARKGVKKFREGSRILGGFVVLVSIQFFVYPVLMLISAFG